MPIDHLPDRWRHKAECLRGVVMSDAGVMIILGVSMIVRGVSYMNLGSVVLFHPVDMFFPIWVDATLWTGMGTLLIAAARWHNRSLGRATLAASTGLLALWGLLFLFAPPAQFAQLGVIYLALAAVIIWSVWRGRRGEIRIREGVTYGGSCTR